MTRKKSEDAVSPVIGVMLILVVTIVIAAVVAAFATGMMTETEPAPVAKFDVDIYSAYEIHGGTSPNMHLTLVSGDSIDTRDLKLSFSWDCLHGTSCPFGTGGHHSSSYQYTGDGKWGTYNKDYGGSQTAFGGIASVFAPEGYNGTSIEPLYINYGGYAGAFFGSKDDIMKRGQTYAAYELHLPRDCENAGNPAMDVLFNNGKVKTDMPSSSLCPECGPNGYIMGSVDEGFSCLTCGGVFDDLSGGGEGLSAGIMECLPRGTSVHVMITHIPSNKLIYDAEVFVE